MPGDAAAVPAALAMSVAGVLAEGGGRSEGAAGKERLSGRISPPLASPSSAAASACVCVCVFMCACNTAPPPILLSSHPSPLPSLFQHFGRGFKEETRREEQVKFSQLRRRALPFDLESAGSCCHLPKNLATKQAAVKLTHAFHRCRRRKRRCVGGGRAAEGGGG